MAGGEIAPGGALGDGRGDASRAASRRRSIRAINAHRRPAPHEPRPRAAARAGARGAILEAAAGYSTVEYDPARGARGKRQDHVRALARDLFGCGDALAVNNNAAAVLLALAALARGRRSSSRAESSSRSAARSRSPRSSRPPGARLREVGTTNRTTADDYRARSRRRSRCSFRSIPPTTRSAATRRARRRRELAALAREAGVPWLHDQGTGVRRAARRVRRAGRADGRRVPRRGRGPRRPSPATSSSRARRPGSSPAARTSSRARAAHPVARAVRPDKLTLAALAATLAAWKTGAWQAVPGLPRRRRAALDELERARRADPRRRGARGGSTVRDRAPRARRSAAARARRSSSRRARSRSARGALGRRPRRGACARRRRPSSPGVERATASCSTCARSRRRRTRSSRPRSAGSRRTRQMR